MMELAKGIALHYGDCVVVLPTLAECSIDSCVTDPPYHLSSIVKRFGGENSAPAQFGNDGRYARASTGFMGKQWDGGDIAFQPETWTAIYRVLKPGAHLLAFGGTRTYHRMACAIEDAGFEIRDSIQWLYGSGFPKSHDVSKGIDRAAGAEREKIRTPMGPTGNKYCKGLGDGRPWMETAAEIGYHEHDSDEPATDAALQWQGWGTALKPACELICLARKPLSEKTVAANVLKWGTGAINVDGCRVPCNGDVKPRGSSGLDTDLHEGWARPWMEDRAEVKRRQDAATERANNMGRWPANVIHDGSDEVVAAFPDAGGGFGKRGNNENSTSYGFEVGTMETVGYGDEGSAARFFYTAKADSDDRLGSKHPTVKPLDLMQYLVRLITPKGGTVLDPFAGTGTTGEAAFREGMHAMLIEREQEYLADMQRRMRLVMAGPDERRFQAAKARQADKPMDAGPLFGGTDWDEMWRKPFDKPEYL